MRKNYRVLLSLSLIAVLATTLTTNCRKSEDPSQYTIPTGMITEGSLPSISPDGKSIAFVDHQEIWVIDLITKERRKITTVKWNANPKWSPDSKKIIFQSYGESMSNRCFSIWMVNADGSDQHQFCMPAFGDYGDQYPFWSKDGKKVVWTHGLQLWIADRNGLNARPLTKDPGIKYEYMADWSKDSKTILYIRNDHDLRIDHTTQSTDSAYFGYYQLCMVDTNSMNQKRIDLLNNIFSAKFDRDDSGIFYNSYGVRFNKYNLATKEVIRNPLNHDFYNGNYDFSSDYKYITYDDDSVYNEQPKIYILKLE